MGNNLFFLSFSVSEHYFLINFWGIGPKKSEVVKWSGREGKLKLGLVFIGESWLSNESKLGDQINCPGQGLLKCPSLIKHINTIGGDCRSCSAVEITSWQSNPVWIQEPAPEATRSKYSVRTLGAFPIVRIKCHSSPQVGHILGIFCSFWRSVCNCGNGNAF